MMNTLLTFALQVTPNLENKVSGANDTYVWIALVAGLLALGLGVYIFTVLSALKKKQEDLVSEITLLRGNKSSAVDKKADEVFRNTADRRLDELENRVYAIENPPRTKEWSSGEITVNKAVVKGQKISPQQKKGGRTAVNEQVKTGNFNTEKLPAERHTDGIDKQQDAAAREQSQYNQPVQESNLQESNPAVPIQKVSEKVIPAVQVPQEEFFYAKFPNSKGAFSAEELIPVQNGELVYEIKLKDGAGVYEISQDIDAQKYALSDVNYYLSEGCDFINQPSKDSWIINKSEGKLIQSGGQWVIQEKAVIEFR